MKRLALLTGLLALLWSVPAVADPGVGAILDVNGVALNTLTKTGDSGALSYTFTTAVDSVAFNVGTGKASVCFTADQTTGTGDARISVFQSMIPGPDNLTDEVAINLGTVPFLREDCTLLDEGWHWIKVDVARSAAEIPLVVIKGLRS